MKSEKTLNALLNLKLDFKRNIFKKTKFDNENIENSFQKYLKKFPSSDPLIFNMIIMINYLASFIFILISNVQFNKLVICLGFLSLSLIISLLKYTFFSNCKNREIFDKILIFLSFLYLLIKAIVICFLNINEENEFEMLRIIIYQCVSINILMIIKIEMTLFLSIFYMILNFFVIFISILFSKNNRYYYFEFFISFCIFLIFYLLKKEWDDKLRLLFYKKYKFKEFYLYTLDYLKSMNGYTLSIKNNSNLFSNKKFNDLINSSIKIKISNSRNSKEKGVLENYENKGQKSYFKGDELAFEINNYHKSDEEIVNFLRNLIFFENYEQKPFLFNNKQTETNIPNIERINVYSCLSDLNCNNSKLKETNYSISLFEIIQNLSIGINQKANDENKENFYKFSDNNDSQEINILEPKIDQIRNHNDSNQFDNYRNNIYTEKKKINQNAGFENHKKSYKYQYLTDSQKKNPFKSLGIYYVYNKEKKKFFFNVFHRSLHLDPNNVLDNYFFQDITDIILTKQTIIKENARKQKVFAKMAHEFKTPLNSVIGISTQIKDSELKLSNTTCDKLEIIQNLSNYLIFLVSDIIQFATIKEISQINFNYSYIDIREILNFCFQILNSLLTLNKRKEKDIISELRFIDCLDSFIIESDEIRIKQILLNFISNAVKFTKEGKIILKVKKISTQEKTFLEISVKDTGIGIKNEDQELLFEEFKTLENGNDLNKINNSCGSGLGLNICKALCEKLNFELKMKSKYSYGSKFSIFIPVEENPIFTIKKTISIDDNKESLKEKNITINESSANVYKIIDNTDNNSNLITLYRCDIVPLNIEIKNTLYNNSSMTSSRNQSLRKYFTITSNNSNPYLTSRINANNLSTINSPKEYKKQSRLSCLSAKNGNILLIF